MIGQDEITEESENVQENDQNSQENSQELSERTTYAIINQKAAKLLEHAGDGPLDERLQNIAKEKENLIEQIKQLRRDLNEKDRNELLVNGSKNEHQVEMEIMEVQREASKTVGEYKIKLQNCEQTQHVLQTSLSRCEVQLARTKQICENFEKNEDEMRAEKRRLQRDLRTALDRIEENELQINHLEKRLNRARTNNR